MFTSKIKANDGVCCFYDGEEAKSEKIGRCSVYSQKPAVCSLYPFYLGIDHKGTLLLCVEHCLGVDEENGELITEDYIREKILTVLDSDFGHSYVKLLQSLVQNSKPAFMKLLTHGNLVCSWEARSIFFGKIVDSLSKNSRLSPSSLIFSYLEKFVHVTGSMYSDNNPFVSSEMLQQIVTTVIGSYTEADFASRERNREVAYLKELIMREGTHRGLFVGNMSIEEELAFLRVMATITEGRMSSSSVAVNPKSGRIVESIAFADAQSADVANAILNPNASSS
jgi:hypothetical protein